MVTACATSYVPKSNSAIELQSYVERAARLVQEKGKDACAAFDQPQWKAGEYYIFVTNARTNVTVCHPVRSDLVGQDQTNLQDVNGRYFIREMLAVATGPEHKGWVDYAWPRPDETTPSTKNAYVVGVTGPDGTPYVVGSGAYGVPH